MVSAQTCPLLVWLSIKHDQPDCTRKCEIMSLESNQSNVCQGLLKVLTLKVSASKDVLQIWYAKMFTIKKFIF